MKWTTRTGEVVRIEKMEDSHLIHTIKFLERKAEMYRTRYELEGVALESTLHGDGALDCLSMEMESLAEAEPSDLLPDPVNKQYVCMRREADRRGLRW